MEFSKLGVSIGWKPKVSKAVFIVFIMYVRLATSVDEKSLVPFGMLGFIKTIFGYLILAKLINLVSGANIRKILGSTIL